MIMLLSYRGYSGLLLFVSLLSVGNAFYIPGEAPLTFSKGEEVPLKVNSLTSRETQIPHDYYRLPFCQPEGGPVMASQNLGQFLTGNKIQSSPYVIHMLTEAYCTKLCQVELSKTQAAKLSLHIKYGYRNNWIIDNLPSAHIGLAQGGRVRKRYGGGFPIGFVSSETEIPYVYNHVNIVIDYHPYDDGYRVVGFAVEPLSVEHHFQGGYVWDGVTKEGLQKPLETCSATSHWKRTDISSFQPVAPGTKILYTYDVMWVESQLEWSSRWDIYLTEDDLVPAHVCWNSIENSIFVVIFLSLLLISVEVRNLRRDVDAYHEYVALDDEEKEAEEVKRGWKSLHADVFRPPLTHPMLFCVFCGSGAQLALTAFSAISIPAVGFVNTARRGSLMLAILILYVLSGVVGGYVSSILYKAFDGRQWQLCSLVTAILVPGFAFCLFAFFNVILFFQRDSVSAPLWDVFLVVLMWCGVSIPLVFMGASMGYRATAIEFPTTTSTVAIPLVFMGASMGYRAPAIEFPTTTSTVARAIPPPSSFVMHPGFLMTVAGIVPFWAAYVELFFIMVSLWTDQFYSMFGFTLMVCIIMMVLCAEITVLMVYYQLRNENHRWWWFSFCTSGSVALFTFINSIFWFRQLNASGLVMTYMLYFGCMFLMCGCMFLVLGMVGAMTSLWFVRTIFAALFKNE